MSARERILDRLRAAPGLGAELPPDVDAYFAMHSRSEEDAARLQRFKANIEAAHAEVFITDQDSWPELLHRIAHDKNLHTLLLGTGLPHTDRLAAQATEDLRLVPYDRKAETWRNEMFETVDASLTLARAAIADTGSLILWPDAHEPRLLSLVPPVHFVLLDARNIHADLHAAMTTENWAAAMPTNALVISGPSKTADIQQTLAYGAHGPREVIVLLCRGSVHS